MGGWQLAVGGWQLAVGGWQRTVIEETDPGGVSRILTGRWIVVQEVETVTPPANRLRAAATFNYIGNPPPTLETLLDTKTPRPFLPPSRADLLD